MMVELMITSLQNPLVKHIRKLHQSKQRRLDQQFLLEGTHLIQEAQRVGWPLVTLCCTSAWVTKQSADFIAQLRAHSQHWELVSPEVLQAMATTVNPDGVIAIAQEQVSKFPPLQSLGIVLETLQDPGNLGTILRTAAAAGVEGVYLSADSVAPTSPKVLRASAGVGLWLPIADVPDLRSVLTGYQAQGWQIVATLPQATQTYWQADLRRPSLILLGNEGAGLSLELAAMADTTVSIPLAAGVESLNVAVAAALILYEAKRQRSPDL